jgi:transposase-like protein
MTTGELRKLRALAAKGYTYIMAGAEIGRHRVVVARWDKKVGLGFVKPMRRRGVPTDDDIRRHAGASFAAAARALGCAESTVRRRHRKESLGFDVQRRRRTSPEDLARLQALCAGGDVSIGVAARALGMNRHVVRCWGDRLNIRFAKHKKDVPTPAIQRVVMRRYDHG